MSKWQLGLSFFGYKVEPLFFPNQRGAPIMPGVVVLFHILLSTSSGWNKQSGGNYPRHASDQPNYTGVNGSLPFPLVIFFRDASIGNYAILSSF